MNPFSRKKPPEYYANLELTANEVLNNLLKASITTTQSDREWQQGYRLDIAPVLFGVSDPMDNFSGRSNLVRIELPTERYKNYWTAVASVPLTLAEAGTRKDIPQVLNAALKDYDIRPYETRLGYEPQMERDKSAQSHPNASVVFSYRQPFATAQEPDAFLKILRRNLPEIRQNLHEACTNLNVGIHSAGTGTQIG